MKLDRLIWFGIGAVLGGAVTYVAVRDKFTTMMDEEIEEVRKYYKSKMESLVEPKQGVAEEVKVEVEIEREYKEIITDYSPTNYVDDECDIDEEEGYVTIIESRDLTNGVEFNEVSKIEHYQVGDQPLYDTETLIFYADGVVTNEEDEVIKNVEELVGQEALTWLKESEDQSIFVRNDPMRTDYELIKDDWKFSDLTDSE